MAIITLKMRSKLENRLTTKKTNTMKKNTNGVMPNDGDITRKIPVNRLKKNGSELDVKIPAAGKKNKPNKPNKSKKPGNTNRQKSNDTMVPFAAGDLVFAINIDMSGPILPGDDISQCSFGFPDGPLRSDVIYRVKMTFLHPSRPEQQGVMLDDMRVDNGFHEIPWHYSRFRMALRNNLQSS